MNRIRIGVAGLVALALTGVSAGGAVAATGRGTATATVTLLDISLGNVQNIKVLTDEGQGTVDPARLGLPGPRAFGQLTAVRASGAVNLDVPSPPIRAEAPGTTSGGLDPITLSVPDSQIQASTGLPVGAGMLASGNVDPTKVEAIVDAAGARAAVGTEISGLNILQGLVSVGNVRIADITASAGASASQGDSGVVTIADITVLDLSAFLGALDKGLADLNVANLVGLVDVLGLPVSTTELGSLTPGDISGVLSTATGLVTALGGVAAATTCDDLVAATSLLSGVDELLAGDGLLGFLGLGSLSLDSLLGGCTVSNFVSTQSSVTDLLTDTLDGVVPTTEDVLGSVFSVLESAPLIQLSGVELSAVARAVETLAGSSASTSAKLGTLRVGALDLGALDLAATVDQVNALVASAKSTLSGVTSMLGLPDLIDIGIMERTASTRAEGVYNVADAAISVLRVSINPPADLTGILAAATALPVGDVLSGVVSNLPVDTGLATGTLASAFGLTSLLSQPTTITVGRIGAEADFTTVSGAGGPVSPPVGGELPRTGGPAALIAVLALLSLAGAFGVTRSLRKEPGEG